MKRDLTKIFFYEIYINSPKKRYETNKIIYNHIDEKWSIDLADMFDYKNPNNKDYTDYRYSFVITDKFSKYIRAMPLKNKTSKTVTDEFSNIIFTSKRRLFKLESDRGK